MLGIKRIRSVTAAQKERAVNGSRASWPPAFNHLWVGAGWSVKPMPAKPDASATSQKRVSVALVVSSGLYGCAMSGYVTQKFMPPTLVFR